MPSPELILAQLDRLPTLPAVAGKVVMLTADDRSSAAEVVRLLESDPAMATRVLQLAQRADRPLAGEVSVERAVVAVGFEAVRAAVLALGVLKVFPHGGKGEGGFDHVEFWKHCLAVACAAELLAERLRARGGRINPGEAFVCGLLHDVGKIALSAAVPKSYGRIAHAAENLRTNIADIEHRVLGLDHNAAGRRLADRWRLPAVIRDVIWLHNQHPAALAPLAAGNPLLVNLVTLADQMARARHLGCSGNYTAGAPLDAVLEATGLTEADAAAAGDEIVARMEPRAAILGLGNADAESIYRQALRRASTALAQTQTQLRQTRTRLQAQASEASGLTASFAAVGRLGAAMHPDATTGEVLRAIGQSACAALQAPAVAVVALPPEGLHGSFAVCAGGDVLDAGALPPGIAVPGASAGDAAFVRLPPELEAASALAGPRLEGQERWWLTLEIDGLAIGGLILGGTAGLEAGLQGKPDVWASLRLGWSLALRSAQVREAARLLAERLVRSNRELAEAQEQMARDHTLLAVAEVAAGAAHEMNNPLMVISGRSQLLYHQLKDARHRQAALLIHQNSTRLSEMITQLMRFARPSGGEPIPTPIEVLVADALKLLAHLPQRHDRRIDVDLPALPPVVCDPRQVTRAIGAIVENAIQATDPGGRITVRAAQDLTAQRLVLRIEDDGCGMDAHTLRHAFDPFFSVKPAGRRRGMGLAMALRFIEANGGELRLQSQPGSGACAIIVLPSETATSRALGEFNPAPTAAEPAAPEAGRASA